MTILADIENWMGDTKQALTDEYVRQGLKASGSYAESLEPEIIERPHGYIVRMKADKHAYWMQNGRKANKIKSPEQAKSLYPIILQWNKDKGLNFTNGHVFAICLKIVYKGIRVPNKFNPGGVVGNIITRKRIQGLLDSIGANMLNTFRSDVIKTIKDGK